MASELEHRWVTVRSEWTAEISLTCLCGAQVKHIHLVPGGNSVPMPVCPVVAGQ